MTSSTALVGDTFFGLDLKKVKASFSGFRRRISKRVLLIDFDSASITMAEAQIHTGALTLEHVRRYPLPEEALERGVPAEPPKMAALIRGFCEEMDIPAHRAAVVLPHDAVYTTTVKLPSSVAPGAALDYALNPASAVQVPIQLEQMDVDLFPISLPTEQDQRSYFLTAVPRKLVDRILETLQICHFELVRLQVGIFAQLQHLATTLRELPAGAALLHLEFLRDCTQATLLCSSGPVKLSRLTAIRDFPEPPERSGEAAAFTVLNAETQIIASDSYMPLSDLDLRRLNQEIHQWIQDCQRDTPYLSIGRVVIAGVNSAHPQLASLLQDALGLPVSVSRPLATEGMGQFTTSDGPIVLQSVGRLVGTGLSLLPDSADEIPLEPLLVDPLPTVGVSVVADEPAEALEVELPARVPPAADDPLQDQKMALDSLLVDDIQAESQIAVIDMNEVPGEPQVPIFSFDLSEDDALPDHEPDELSLPLKTQTTIPEEDWMASDPETVPFSLDDLLNSYEAKTAEQQEISASQVDVQEAEVHLVDDPSLWPSVSKLNLKQPADGEKPDDESNPDKTAIS